MRHSTQRRRRPRTVPDQNFQKSFTANGKPLEAKLTVANIAYQVTISPIDLYATDPISERTFGFSATIEQLIVTFDVVLKATLGSESKTFQFTNNTFSAEDVEVEGTATVSADPPPQVTIDELNLTYKDKTVTIKVPDLTKTTTMALDKKDLKPYSQAILNALRGRVEKQVAQPVVRRLTDKILTRLLARSAR